LCFYREEFDKVVKPMKYEKKNKHAILTPFAGDTVVDSSLFELSQFDDALSDLVLTKLQMKLYCMDILSDVAQANLSKSKLNNEFQARCVAMQVNDSVRNFARFVCTNFDLLTKPRANRDQNRNSNNDDNDEQEYEDEQLLVWSIDKDANIGGKSKSSLISCPALHERWTHARIFGCPQPIQIDPKDGKKIKKTNVDYHYRNKEKIWVHRRRYVCFFLILILVFLDFWVYLDFDFDFFLILGLS
jgi:hypothetical protein